MEDSILLPREIADKMREEIRFILYVYDYWKDGSDWTCRFCNRRPKRNGEDITHRDDCRGLLFLFELDKALS